MASDAEAARLYAEARACEEPVRALELTRRAAELGNSRAQRTLGLELLDAASGDDASAAEGVAWLRRAASGSDSIAQYQLGVYFNAGDALIR